MRLRLRVSIHGIFAALTLASACRVADVSTGVPARDVESSRAEIYEAILDTLFVVNRPRVLVIQDSSVIFRTAPGHVQPARQSDFPEQQLAQLNAMSEFAHPLGELGVPPQWRRVPLAQIRSLFHSNPDIGWNNFHSQYPDAQGWLAVTPIVISQDGRRALVYYAWHCGSLCGQGQLASIVRDERGRWRVRHLVNYWVS
jgi:hypothetical protein